MRIPLADMVRRQTNRRRDIVLRPIVTTSAQASSLFALYMNVVRVWHEGARDRILPAYERTLAENSLVRDSIADVELAVAVVEQNALAALFDFSNLFRGWASALQLWHVNKFISSVKYASNVDLTTMLGAGDTRLTIEQAVARNAALVRNVSDQARGRIADIVFRGLQANTPVRDIAKQIAEATGLARARSLRIASDQTVKLSAALDQERQEQVGMYSFKWRHSFKERPRAIHVARDGQEFRWDSAIGKADPPGRLPFCGCKAQGILHL